MLHPNQFQVNEAWILFKLNDAPICTERDGDINIFALMDAASCFLLGSALVTTRTTEPSRLESRRLLEEGRSHKQQLPGKLFIPDKQTAALMSAEAKRQGIAVVRVPEDQLLPIIGEAQEGFRARFGGGAVQ